MNEKLGRLVRMVAGDEGFYVLALHSFMEWYLREAKGYGFESSFEGLIRRLQSELRSEGPEDQMGGLAALSRIAGQHRHSNGVRHTFDPLDAEEAACATYLFLIFCRLVGIENHPAVGKLAEGLERWRARSPTIGRAAVLRSMQEELRTLRQKNREILEKRDELEGLQAKIAEIRNETTGRQLGRGSCLIEGDDEGSRLYGRLHALNERLAAYEDVDRYLRFLGRVTIYTRTRIEFEQSISTLTPEQEQAVSAVTMKKDFLIKGGAGTGKSLVLIEALRRSLEQKELDFDAGYIVFLTYTRTLARYNASVAAIKHMQLPVKMIRTIDSFYLQLLRTIDPGFGFDYEVVERFCESYTSLDFLTAEELSSEIENFLFANAVSREEYLEERILRRGMRRPLGSEQREQVWRVREDLVMHMERERRFSKNYSRIKLLDYLRLHPSDSGLRSISHVFLDEVQDLVPVDLMVMREIARRSLIMAGDTDQSLYTGQSPFGRAGISITGTTRILRTNFRNTCQIHQVAEEFRRLGPEGSWDAANEPVAFREGPPPELYEAASEPELLSLLVKKAELCIDDLGYDPGNIAVLVPRNVEIDHVGRTLATRGRAWVNVTGKEFAFADQGSVRLCTLHSSKGLDFPVVLLYLPYLARRELYDEERTEKLVRNLVYVGMTRAMDCLDVFMRPQNDPVLADVRRAFARN